MSDPPQPWPLTLAATERLIALPGEPPDGMITPALKELALRGHWRLELGPKVPLRRRRVTLVPGEPCGEDVPQPLRYLDGRLRLVAPTGGDLQKALDDTLPPRSRRKHTPRGRGELLGTIAAGVDTELIRHGVAAKPDPEDHLAPDELEFNRGRGPAPGLARTPAGDRWVAAAAAHRQALDHELPAVIDGDPARAAELVAALDAAIGAAVKATYMARRKYAGGGESYVTADGG